MNKRDICEKAGVKVLTVGEVYREGESGNPIPAGDLEKYCVLTPAGKFDLNVVKAIPLATSQEEAETLAVEYLGLIETPIAK